jgi:hypothetical protein
MDRIRPMAGGLACRIPSRVGGTGCGIPGFDPFGFEAILTEGPGDCYLLAVSQSFGSTLVTFDRALASACEKAKHPATLLE